VTAHADWGDVVRRARRGHRRTWIIATVGIAAIAGAASAFALTRPTIDFFSAPKSPRTVVDDFGRQDVEAPPGMASGVLPHQTRRITSVSYRGKEFVLYVAPTKSGGFSKLWAVPKVGGGGGCNRTAGALDHRVDLGSGERAGVLYLTGEFGETTAARVVVTHPDGSSNEVPFVWVGAPIDAGFFLYPLSGAHRDESSERVAVLDASGHVLARSTMPLRSVGPKGTSHHVAGVGYVHVPGLAIYAKRQLLFDLRSATGERTLLWSAPARGGGRCWWTNRGSGCDDGKSHFAPGFAKQHPHLAQLAQVMNLGFNGGNPVVLCCEVGPKVSRVQFRFQDGDRIDYTPRDGYLVVTIPPAHEALGHRLIKQVAYDASGHVLAERSIRTNLPGLYPCTKPKHYAYGVTMCP
jgi:hypothetical protein